MTNNVVDRRSGVFGGQAWKVPCRVATTANVNLSTAGLATIDGVTLEEGDRVLVKSQDDAVENGIYQAYEGLAWQRAADFNGVNDICQGTMVTVADGTANAGTIWQLGTSDPVVGTSELTFSTLIFPSGYVRDVAELEGTTFSTAQTRVYVLAYDSANPANGGAAWWDKRTTTPSPVKPYHKQSADGAWWEVSTKSQTRVPAMYGYVAASTTASGRTVTAITVSTTDPWDDIMGDLQTGQTLVLNDGTYTKSTSTQIVLSGKGKVDIMAKNAGQADVNARFDVTSMGRLIFTGIHFVQLNGSGPQGDIIEYLNSVVELTNCTGACAGSGRMTNGKGNTQLSIDPGDYDDSTDTVENRDVLFDWSSSTAKHVFLQEENCEVFIRGGKITLSGVVQSYRRRVVIKASASQTTALYVLTGNLYVRSPCVRGAGTSQGNGIALARHAHGYMFTYPTAPASVGKTFRDPGYTYEDDDTTRECGVRGFKQGIALRGNSKLVINSDDFDSDTDDPEGFGSFVFRELANGVYFSAGDLVLASSHVTWSSVTQKFRMNENLELTSDHSLQAIHTDVTTSTTLTKSDVNRVIRADATSGAINVDLPSSAHCDGDWVALRKTDTSTNVVKLRTSGGTDLAWMSNRYDEVRWVYWNSAWVMQRKEIAPLQETWTTSGTTTVPPLITGAEFRLCSGGNGGGSGARETAGTVASGGAGGNGGHWVRERLPASVIGTGTKTVTVGAGGAGGAAVTSDDTVGNAGSMGGTTSIALTGFTLLSAQSGTAAGGSTSAASGGTVTASRSTWGQPGAGGGSSVSAAGSNGNVGGCGGGGGGGTVTAANAAQDGGAGGNGSIMGASVSGGAAGTSAGNGSDGGAASEGTNLQGGSGGGGGGAAAAAASGAGGAGGAPGGGGGGGAGSRNGNNSGAGGTGGRGELRITWYF